MDISVGAEHVIANTLITFKRLGLDCISFSDLRSLGWNIQRYCNENGIDAIILTTSLNIQKAVYDFSDYFEYYEDRTNGPMIRIKSGVLVEKVQERFLDYLPLKVEQAIRNEAEKFKPTCNKR